MTPTEANRIINEYGAVLETTAPMLFGAPETLLPFDRELIKRAIRFALAFLKTNPETCCKDLTEQIEPLKIAYGRLADFIPVEDAKIAAAADAALLSGDTNHPDRRFCDRGLEIAAENLARRKALSGQLAAFLESF